MSDNSTNTERLIQYLDGDLDPSEAKELEDEVSSNKGLHDELENLRLSAMAVKSYGLKQEIATIHFEAMRELQAGTPPSRVRRIVRISMRIAASLLFILFAAGVYEYATISSKSLYNQQYQAFTLPVSRGGEISSPAKQAFMEKDYDKVINIAESQKSSEGYSPLESFLAAQSYLAKNEIRNAIYWFEATRQKNINNMTSTYQDDTEYYLALCYLDNKQVQQAWPLFQKIHESETHLYHDKVDNWFMSKLQLLRWKK